jgi:predicted pyridoxine 5'-phosphate oxidase superfamily flavin-nucleotide-binding protein
MFTEEIKRVVEGNPQSVVATADAAGIPHLALGGGAKLLNGNHLMLEQWYCQTTLRNLDQNPRIAIAVMDHDSIVGFQFIGNVVHGYDTAMLDGYVPGAEQSGGLQALTRIIVRVEEILAFCSGIHTDLPLGG